MPDEQLLNNYGPIQGRKKIEEKKLRKENIEEKRETEKQRLYVSKRPTADDCTHKYKKMQSLEIDF